MAAHPPAAAVGRAVKCGIGRLTATATLSGGGSASVAVPAVTRLTEVAHLSPTRIIPMRLTSVESAGAALCAVSSYGGGMVRGDRQDLTLHVGESARLGLVTQGPTRIYRSGSLTSSSSPSTEQDARDEDPTCRATLRAKVGPNGLLVVAPDPLVPFSRSSFAQRQQFDLGPGASLILVDWFSAGRIANGERWDFDRVSSRSELRNEGVDAPFLVESVALDRRFAFGDTDPFGFGSGLGTRYDAFASVLIYGPAGVDVSSNFAYLSRGLGGSFTRIRGQEETFEDSEGDDVPFQHDLALGGRVLLGLSKVDNDHGDGSNTDGEAYVARIAATSNEDMYRVLHACLRPLKGSFGVEFYKDRIHGSSAHVNLASTKVSTKQRDQIATEKLPGQRSMSSRQTSAASTTISLFDEHAAWCALMLADSGLPTGSFAHSAGIEAASQLGLFGTQSDPDQARVSNYVRAATRSATQLLTPFALRGHALSTSREWKTEVGDVDAVYKKWLMVDRYAHATLASNGPGCRASLDQGHGLLRVAIQWLREAEKQQPRILADGAMEVLQLIQREIDRSANSGHVGPLFGLVGGSLRLSSETTCRLLGYCAARDMVSAAVRLNLIGPMSGVSVLDSAWSAVREGTNAALASMAEAEAGMDGDAGEERILRGIESAAGCSPVVEAVHPTHELLAVRLFRT